MINAAQFCCFDFDSTISGVTVSFESTGKDEEEHFSKMQLLVALGEGLLSNNQSSMAGTVGLGPFLEPWTGKYNGYPRFDLVKASGVQEAMLKGMELRVQRSKL